MDLVIVLSFLIWGLPIALMTTCLYLIISKVPNRIMRVIIPIFYCIFIFPLIIILHPSPDNILYPFALISGFAFTCMLILIPFPLFEKKLQVHSQKYVVFFGAVITTVFAYSLNQSPRLFSSIAFLSPLIIVAFAALVFAGITVILITFIKTNADQYSIQTSELEQSSNKLNKSNILKIAFLLLIICMIPFLLVYGKEWFFGSDSDTGIIIILVNKSEAQNGNIIHLTEKDFKEFPRLASVIRDNEQKTAVEWPGGKNAYSVLITDQERYRFIELYWSNYSGLENGRFFEYDEKYYSYNYPPIA